MALALACLVNPAWALYKIVGPDGKVTYSDRPPTAEAAGKVNEFRPGLTAPPTEADPKAAIPAALRQPVSRYPATLYTSDGCQACETARQFLIRRGVPFAERRVSTQDDIRALAQMTGDRTMPALSLGQQHLKGFNEIDWHAYLDAAGYPKESLMPAAWKPASAQPLAEAVKPASAAQSSSAQPPALAPAAIGR